MKLCPRYVLGSVQRIRTFRKTVNSRSPPPRGPVQSKEHVLNLALPTNLQMYTEPRILTGRADSRRPSFKYVLSALGYSLLSATHIKIVSY